MKLLGGRFDPGMLYFSPQIWCSDNTDALARMKIQYGTSMVCDYHLLDITQHKYQELNYIRIENAFVNQISNKSAYHNVMKNNKSVSNCSSPYIHPYIHDTSDIVYL